MSALPENIVAFQLPKRPKVREKQAPPDQRTLCVLPFRAVADKQLTDGALRVLAAICSYCNRAGITWVSQAKIAKDLGVTQQAISKHAKLLVSLGYLQIVRKGFRGERSNTIRVIFDPTVDTDTAIAITSAQEDTRPPAMQDTPDPAGQARIASLIAQAFKTPPTERKTMPKTGETRTVKAIKEANNKATRKRTAAQPKGPAVELIRASDLEAELRARQLETKRTYTTPEVVHEEAVIHSPHTQPESPPYTTSEVVRNTENTGIDKVKSKSINTAIGVLDNLSAEQRAEVAAAGVTATEASQALQLLLDAYRAEGITPNPDRLAAEVISLADAGRIQ
jgi:hypothetical protein